MNEAGKLRWNERARERMAELGVTQTALAKSLGVVRAAVSHYLSGRTEPSLSLFAHICRHLQVSSDWLLFGGTGGPLPSKTQSDRLAQQIASLDASSRRDIESFLRVKSASNRAGL